MCFDTMIAFEGSTGDLFPYIYVADILWDYGNKIIFCCSTDHTLILDWNGYKNVETGYLNFEVI